MGWRGLDARPRPAALLIVATIATVIACSQEGTPCYPGDYVACACASGARGYSKCSAGGAGYGACDCSGAIPGLPAPGGAADAGGGADASASGLLGLMDPCERNEQCESGLCFPFNAKGPKCSKRCATASDCPPPAAGCNNQMICKAP